MRTLLLFVCLLLLFAAPAQALLFDDVVEALHSASITLQQAMGLWAPPCKMPMRLQRCGLFWRQDRDSRFRYDLHFYYEGCKVVVKDVRKFRFKQGLRQLQITTETLSQQWSFSEDWKMLIDQQGTIYALSPQSSWYELRRRPQKR